MATQDLLNQTLEMDQKSVLTRLKTTDLQHSKGMLSLYLLSLTAKSDSQYIPSEALMVLES